jgi:hypothetical protein
MKFNKITIKKENSFVEYKISEFSFNPERKYFSGPKGERVMCNHRFSLLIRNEEMYEAFRKGMSVEFYLESDTHKYSYGGYINGHINPYLNGFFAGVEVVWYCENYPEMTLITK